MIRLLMLFLGFAWPFLLKLFWWAVAALGVGFVTYAGVGAGFDYLIAGVQASKSNLEATGYGSTFTGAIAHFAGRFGVTCLLQGVAAGYASRIALAGLGAFRKMVFKT